MWGGKAYGVARSMIWSMIWAIGRRAVNMFLPPTCPISGERVDVPGHLAASAWARLRFLTPPWCARCGVPFDYDQGAGALCDRCASSQSILNYVRSPLAYDDASRGLILPMKHAGRLAGLDVFGRWMAQSLADLPCDLSGAMIIPVPLHGRRLRQRKFNQSAVLARALERALPLCGDGSDGYQPRAKVFYDVLYRNRETASQGGLSAGERQENVSGAFGVHPGSGRGGVAGARIVLVDDVFTTGATARACARALKNAGARSVTVVTLARVVQET